MTGGESGEGAGGVDGDGAGEIRDTPQGGMVFVSVRFQRDCEFESFGNILEVVCFVWVGESMAARTQRGIVAVGCSGEANCRDDCPGSRCRWGSNGEGSADARGGRRGGPAADG